MAIRLCRSCNGWHDLNEPWPETCSSHFAKHTQNHNQVIKDIEPYRAVDGTVIKGRRQHRDHLRAHGYIEVGNEKLPPRKIQEVPGRAQEIARVYDQLSSR